jgi:hypothetical protein
MGFQADKFNCDCTSGIQVTLVFYQPSSSTTAVLLNYSGCVRILIIAYFDYLLLNFFYPMVGVLQYKVFQLFSLLLYFLFIASNLLYLAGLLDNFSGILESYQFCVALNSCWCPFRVASFFIDLSASRLIWVRFLSIFSIPRNNAESGCLLFILSVFSLFPRLVNKKSILNDV